MYCLHSVFFLVKSTRFIALPFSWEHVASCAFAVRAGFCVSMNQAGSWIIKYLQFTPAAVLLVLVLVDDMFAS